MSLFCSVYFCFVPSYSPGAEGVWFSPGGVGRLKPPYLLHVPPRGPEMLQGLGPSVSTDVGSLAHAAHQSPALCVECGVLAVVGGGSETARGLPSLQGCFEMRELGERHWRHFLSISRTLRKHHGDRGAQPDPSSLTQRLAGDCGGSRRILPRGDPPRNLAGKQNARTFPLQSSGAGWPEPEARSRTLALEAPHEPPRGRIETEG